MTTKLLANRKEGLLKNTLLSSLESLMEKDSRVMQLDSDLAGAVGLYPLYEKFPKQTLNVGIMEANMIGVACGLSVMGKIPFVHTFGMFIARRALDQVFMSGSYNKANVKMIGTDPGVTAEKNGGTHMPFEDVGILRTIPEMTIIDCADPVMLSKLIPIMANTYGMMYLRMPRNKCVAIYDSESTFEIGKGNILVEGSDITIIASGIEVEMALDAASILYNENIFARVVDMFTIKPIDAALVIDCAKKTGAIVTCENANYINGLGSAVAEILSEKYLCPLERVGVKDLFGEVGDREYLLKRFNLTATDILAACMRVINRKNKY